MAGLIVGAMVLPLALGLLVAGLVRLVDTLRSRGAARSAQARSLGASAATGVVGLTATLAWLGLADGLHEDIRLSTVPALGCAAAVLTAAVAELTWPRPTGAVRTASLDPRRAHRPAWLSRWSPSGSAATAAALVIGSLTAAPDGRSFDPPRRRPRRHRQPVPRLVVRPGGRDRRHPARAGDLVRLGEGRRPTGPRPGSRGPRRGRPRRLDGAGAAPGGRGFAEHRSRALADHRERRSTRVTQNLRMNDAAAPQPPFDWVQNLGFAAITVGVVLLLLTLAALLSGSPRLPREDAAPATASPRWARERSARHHRPGGRRAAVRAGPCPARRPDRPGQPRRGRPAADRARRWPPTSGWRSTPWPAPTRSSRRRGW